MRYLVCFLLLISPAALFAQQQSLKGIVLNEQGLPLPYVSAAILYPEDSTLAYFGISDEDGIFIVRNVATGQFLLQLSCMGYQTSSFPLQIPVANDGDLGVLLLESNPLMLDAVTVNAEHIPLRLKNDTVEYDAGAYKTQPDAAVEDLLKKLPGVQVDQAGNIKAQGEDVRQVLVDGKEFFSSDPKVATKNLPADAVSKVQVFDQQSDESDFTGIDDGSRSKTINLLLKDDKKSAWMGDVQAGAGTGNHYLASAKAYRFTRTNQFAALGMLNNINQFGFSMNDYIDFNGGIGNLMAGGGGLRIETGSEDELPIDFGQQIDGLITSGAGGVNFTHEAKAGNRSNISFLGNGFDKQLIQTSLMENFAPGYSFATEMNTEQQTRNYGSKLNFNFRHTPDSMQRILATGSAAISGGKMNAVSGTENYQADSLVNSLMNTTYEQSASIRGTTSVSYLHKSRSNWKVFKSDLSLEGKATLNEAEWKDLTQFFPSADMSNSHQYQDNRNRQLDYSGGFAAHRKLNNRYYLVPAVRVGGTSEQLNREQGIPDVDESEVDSLSPDFSRSNQWMQTGIALRYSSKKSQWRLSLAARAISWQSELNGYQDESEYELYFVPQLSLQKEIRPGQHLRLNYETAINAPNANQLLPVSNNVNPLEVFAGNTDLKPEYQHAMSAHWMLFDQFSFTSLFTNLNFVYTKDKINYFKTIDDDLSQSLSLINVRSDYKVSAGLEFSTPVRPIGLNLQVGFQERYNRGINYVDETANIINAFTHELSLSFDNRKKDKIATDFGGRLEWSSAAYSIQSEMNVRYVNWSYFIEALYTPSDRWSFSFNADLYQYGWETYDASAYVPLLQLEVIRYVFKSNRGLIALKGFDLLNRNSGISQITEFNYVQQLQSNTIGRYVMLSFKYRLSKFNGGQEGINIKVNGR